MMTTTHVLMAATAGVALKRQGRSLPMKWLVFGGVAPDLALLVLTGGYMVALQQGWLPGERLFGPLYDTLYFTNPIWIAGYNLLHAPLVIAALIGAGVWAVRRGALWGAAMLWFGVGCALHTAGDIPVHHNDGPLLLFPFEWSVRFYSPVSYWHPDYYAAQFGVFETLLVVAMLAYLLIPPLLRWVRRVAQPTLEQREYPD